MKKFMAFILVLAMVLAVLPQLAIFAATGELLKNPGFETGDSTAFFRYGPSCTVTVDKKYAHSGNYGMLISERKGQYATYAQDVKDILTLNGPGEYVFSMWAKLPDGVESTAKCFVVLNYQSNAMSSPLYLGSGQKVLTHEWQQFTFKGNITFDAIDGFKTALIYPQFYESGVTDSAPSIIVDDFTLKKNGEPNGIDPSLVVTPAPTDKAEVTPPPTSNATGQATELLLNPDFEDGTTGYFAYGNCTYTAKTEYARSGNYGVLISTRSNKDATIAQDIADVLTLNGPGEYQASCWIKLKEPATETYTGHLCINVKSTAAESNSYKNSGQKTLTTEWQQFIFKGNIDFDPVKGFDVALIYPRTFGGESAPEIIVDGFSLVKLSEVNGVPLDQVEGSVSGAKKGDEMIENGGFETGDETGFDPYGGTDMEIVEEAAHNGKYGMLLYNRIAKTSYQQNIGEKLQIYGPGRYLARVYVRLKDAPEEECNGRLRIDYVTLDGKKGYLSSKEKPLTTEWQEFALRENNFDFVAADGFDKAVIYFETTKSYDIMIDDFSLKKESEVNGIESVENTEYADFQMTNINVMGETRAEETSFGAIRWDAWYSHNGRPDSIVTQVEKTLSLKEYHFRAPFFANVTAEGNIEMPVYTQDIFDQEMEYAIEAGIDYFAYLWYDGEMSAARQMHATSKYKNDVKMSICLLGSAINSKRAREDVLNHMQQDYFMTVLNGRPLMYYYINTSSKSTELTKVKNDIRYYRAKAQELGIPAPYAVVMNVSAKETLDIFGDAVSRYSYGGTNKETFNDFITRVQNSWKSYQSSGTNSQYVPSLTFGWHAEPRYKTPVSWMDVEADSYVPYPTDEEMYNHISYALSYLDHSSTELLTKANTMIFYAWNEHDEGSWICPTIAVDENGNQLYNEDGSKKINDSRVQIVKRAIEDFKNGKRTEVIINGLSNISTSIIGDVDGPCNTPTAPIWLFVGIGAGALVVIGGAVTLVILKKKKGVSKNEQNQ